MGKVNEHVAEKLLFGILVFAFSMTLFGKTDVYADEVEFEYKITADSDDWFNYTVKQKVEMLKIDEDTLKNMTEEQLVKAIADYPYLIDVLVYGGMENGIKTVSKYCDALRELQTRENWQEALDKYSTMLIETYNENPREDGRSDIVRYLLARIVAQCTGNEKLISEYRAELEKRYEGQPIPAEFAVTEETDETDAENTVTGEITEVSDNEVDNMEETSISVATDESNISYSALSAPMTPAGSVVQYTIPGETHSAFEHLNADNELANRYGVMLISIGSCKYNCHSYAWHSTSSSNIYWINDPSVYMTDGSYLSVYSGSISTSTYYCNASVGDKVYYASNSHSAIFADNPANGAPLASADVYSKWGDYGVFRHDVNSVPSEYDCSSVSIWH